MSEASTFVQQIGANPDAHAPRLAYADWLDAQGFPERAALLRVQCALAEMDANDRRRPELEHRESELQRAFISAWLPGPLAEYLSAKAVDDKLGLRAFAEQHQALPLLSDMGGSRALRHDGEVVVFSWDDPQKVWVEEDERARIMVVIAGSRIYPELRLLVPPRPKMARDCPQCRGTGIFIHPRVICNCGGCGWVLSEHV